MSFLRNLCCGSSSAANPAEPAPRPAGKQDQPREKVTDPGAAKLPRPPSDFITHLAENPETPSTELLKPYLDYELWLRKAFARGETQLDGLANLVPVYDKRDEALKIRNVDRKTNDGDKYLIRLPDSHVKSDGAPATAASLEEYKRNFEAFTHCKSACY